MEPLDFVTKILISWMGISAIVCFTTIFVEPQYYHYNGWRSPKAICEFIRAWSGWSFFLAILVTFIHFVWF